VNVDHAVAVGVDAGDFEQLVGQLAAGVLLLVGVLHVVEPLVAVVDAVSHVPVIGGGWLRRGIRNAGLARVRNQQRAEDDDGGERDRKDLASRLTDFYSASALCDLGDFLS
jgi:hypothetical protein